MRDLGIPRAAPSRWRALPAVLACLLLAMAAAGTTAAAGRAGGADAPASASIIGGETATIAGDPWVARIEHKGESGDYWCTGTVISPRVILTAAHCILTEGGGLATASGYEVLTGTADLRQAGSATRSAVVERLVFPGYVPAKSTGDAGLLILSAPVSAPPIRLAGAADTGLLRKGTGVEVTGWGFTDSSLTNPPSVLSRTETTIQSTSYCREGSAAYLPTYYPSLQTCAIEPPSFTSGTCHGDSGGPAIAHLADGTPIEVGIIDLGDPDCSTEAPEVFVRVDQISQWATKWVDAVELGLPAPPIAVPRIVVPKLTLADAKTLAGYALGEDETFGSRFEHGRGIHFDCNRAGRSRVRCGVSWSQGPDDFSGTITVFIAAYKSGEGIYADSRYRIQSVDDYCLHHRPKCEVTTVTNAAFAAGG